MKNAKLNSKRKLATILVACILISAMAVSTVAAVTMLVFSNQVAVDITAKPVEVYPYGVELILNQPANVCVNDPILFTGTLTHDGTPVSNAVVNIHSGLSGSNSIATATTLADGTFTCSYTPTIISKQYFSARTDASLIS